MASKLKSFQKDAEKANKGNRKEQSYKETPKPKKK
jgi:hypothetical protein